MGSDALPDISVVSLSLDEEKCSSCSSSVCNETWPSESSAVVVAVETGFRRRPPPRESESSVSG